MDIRSRFILLWQCVGVAVVASSCSLIVDSRADQCTTAADCVRFRHARCDTATFTCKEDGTGDMLLGEAPTGEDAGSTVQPGVGAGAPAPGGNVDGSVTAFADASCATRDPKSTLNACTNARCRPFDNRRRLTKLNADGGLAPLPQFRDAGAEAH